LDERGGTRWGHSLGIEINVAWHRGGRRKRRKRKAAFGGECKIILVLRATRSKNRGRGGAGFLQNTNLNVVGRIKKKDGKDHN